MAKQFVASLCLLIFGLMLLVASAVSVLTDSSPILESPFVVTQPLQVSPEVITPETGAKITNGICNETDEVQSITYKMQLVPIPASISTPAITLSEGDLPFEPHSCEAESFDVSPEETMEILATIGDGRYQLYIEIHPNTGEPIELLSNEFEIRH